MLEFINPDTLFSLMPRIEGQPPIGTALPESSRAFLEQIQRRNSDALKAVITENGWPDAAEVGTYAEAAAFMIALHADYDPEFQRLCHALLLARANQGLLAKFGFLAFLTDRILCNDGHYQRFGTQIREVANGCFVPKAIEDPDHIDQIRRQAGLFETLTGYLQRVNDGDLLLPRPLLDGYGDQVAEIHRAEIIPFPSEK